jgi:drug/metabolite transporter (DMT)-like permease
MSQPRVVSLTLLAMIAFAGNSLLCRLALKQTAIDPASFTSIRILSGALALWMIVRLSRRPSVRLSADPKAGGGNWASALALFAYAVAFSFAYTALSAATGALLLFGAVQATMIGYGMWTGERPSRKQMAGLLLAFGGLVWLLLPGFSAPPLQGAVLMLLSGIAWGAYSLRGRGEGDPTRVTAGNFSRAALFAAGLSAALFPWASLDSAGFAYAILSGALASGLGYSIWYTALRGLTATSAAAVQLSVPVIAAAGGVAFLGEAVSFRLLIASVGILGGIALVFFGKADASR